MQKQTKKNGMKLLYNSKHKTVNMFDLIRYTKSILCFS